MYLKSESTLLYVKKIFFRISRPPSERPKTRFLFARFFGLVEEIENWNMMRADEMLRPFVKLDTEILNDPLVVTQFIETVELLRVQGPKNYI
jgi:hypothetical protein